LALAVLCIAPIANAVDQTAFDGDPTSNVFAMDPANGKILWHAGCTRP
jgi:glucose dehydrogenase